MTLKDELEILRGEPIQRMPDMESIPCNETSDISRLCENPVVSVKMLAYNHEPYIRQAIESVLSQETDFPYELLIGEDASTDKTRKICFEYQQRYPEKVRVLWSEKNVGQCANGLRIINRCRGEYIAYCEGDDYWVDSKKLQKQVDILRKYPSVGMVFAKAMIDYTTIGKKCIWNENQSLPSGVIPGRTFFIWHLFGRHLGKLANGETFLMTGSVMLRRELRAKANKEYEIFDLQMRLTDTTTWLAMSSFADVYYLPEVVSAYRQLSTGACCSNPTGVARDAQLIRLYFADCKLPGGLRTIPRCFKYGFLTGYNRLFSSDTKEKNKIWLKKIFSTRLGRNIWGAWYNRPIVLLLYLFGYTPCVQRWINRYNRHFQRHLSNGREIERIYSSL